MLLTYPAIFCTFTFFRVYVSVHSVIQANPLPVGLVLATKLWIYLTTAWWLIPSKHLCILVFFVLYSGFFVRKYDFSKSSMIENFAKKY